MNRLQRVAILAVALCLGAGCAEKKTPETEIESVSKEKAGALETKVAGLTQVVDQQKEQIRVLDGQLQQRQSSTQEDQDERVELDKKMTRLTRLIEQQESELTGLQGELDKFQKQLDRKAAESDGGAPDSAGTPEKERDVEAAEQPEEVRKVNPDEIELAPPVPLEKDETEGGEEAAEEGPTDGGTEGASEAEATAKVSEVLFATAVDREKRKPVDPRNEFTLADPKIYCWIRADNSASEEDVQVVAEWRLDGKTKASVPLTLGKRAKRWRTWSFIRMNDHYRGQWEVDIVDAHGNILASGVFSVK